ncbi:MAG: laccase domain protein [Melioribacteraceae bacterium]|nr:MAG: laccase domain protein [Melioribacteraceae bacterium]
MKKKLKIIKSDLLSTQAGISHGFSTKTGLERGSPFYFNMSLSVGDAEENVIANRNAFFEALGSDYKNAATQYQVHGTGISIVERPGYYGENDAMITNKSNVILTVTSADCVPVLIYDPVIKVIAAVHSGWRGTAKRIVEQVIIELKRSYGSSLQDILVYLGPSISQKNYEVGPEVAEQFENKYLLPKGNKYLLDVPACNRDIILACGVKPENLDVSPLCSYEDDSLHSYRRDGKTSGRAMGAIMLHGDQ